MQSKLVTQLYLSLPPTLLLHSFLVLVLVDMPTVGGVIASASLPLAAGRPFSLPLRCVECTCVCVCVWVRLYSKRPYQKCLPETGRHEIACFYFLSGGSSSFFQARFCSPAERTKTGRQRNIRFRKWRREGFWGGQLIVGFMQWLKFQQKANEICFIFVTTNQVYNPMMVAWFLQLSYSVFLQWWSSMRLKTVFC